MNRILKLTVGRGVPIWINADHISCMHPGPRDEGTYITLLGKNVKLVLESCDHVMILIERNE